MQNNPVCYWEIASHDAEATIEFLNEVFEWEVEYDDVLGIYEVPAGKSDNGFAGGGVFTLKKAKLPFLTMYMKVDDLNSKVKLIEELGGFIVIEPFDIGNGTRICLFNEPSGVTLGMIENRKKKKIM